MRFGHLGLLATLLAASTAPAVAGPPHVRRGPTSPRIKKVKASAGQTTIAPERATQIQTALIKSGYLGGAPSGTWDATTQAAMVKLQADNGWQTKLVPDSRAIIKLGLGPAAESNVVQVSTHTGEEGYTPAIATEESSTGMSSVSNH